MVGLRRISRRRAAQGLAFASLSWTALKGVADAATRDDGSGSFDDATVLRLARTLAGRPYIPPDVSLPAKLADIDYGDYASLRFQAAKALWRAEGLPFQVEFFPRGYLYRAKVDIFEIVKGRARPVAYALDLFDDQKLDRTSFPPDLGFSGFRLHAPINTPDRYEEFAVFQGASYFRAVGRNQVYGLSGRGLALGAGDPHEEFPGFRTFWLERPEKGARALVVHALLDSPSVAGAYRFLVRPGDQTVCDVEATLFPRREIRNMGVAPMSSMFFMGEIDRYRHQDSRAAVHDSQGLEIWNGRGERLWRPVENPSAIQTDAFQDHSPCGFGLMQRLRRPEDYGDPQAYDRRPSLWVEPRHGWAGGDWGEGAVNLLEIATTDANADNISAFWKPQNPWAAGSVQSVRYRLYWGADGPSEPRLARVFETRRSGPQGLSFQLVYRPWGETSLSVSGLQVDVSTSAGKIGRQALSPVSDSPGFASAQPHALRLAFDLDPGGASAAELRARLTRDGAPVSETWLYRWTP